MVRRYPCGFHVVSMLHLSSTSVNVLVWENVGRSFMYIVYNFGPQPDPRGTPAAIFFGSQCVLLILT